jgi:hypothetical protein
VLPPVVVLTVPGRRRFGASPPPAPTTTWAPATQAEVLRAAPKLVSWAQGAITWSRSKSLPLHAENVLGSYAAVASNPPAVITYWKAGAR